MSHWTHRHSDLFLLSQKVGHCPAHYSATYATTLWTAWALSLSAIPASSSRYKTRRTGTNLTLMSLNPGPLHFLCCTDHAMAWTASATSPSPLVETSSESILQFESSGYHCNHTELCTVDRELFTLKIFHVKTFFVLLNIS